jgi:hypothetical protein
MALATPGTTATRMMAMIMNRIAPRVRTIDRPRSLTKPRVSVSSYAMLIAVTMPLTPPEALHSAPSSAMTRPMPSAPLLVDAIVRICSLRRLCASDGSAAPISSTCRCTSCGLAIRP